MERFTADGRFLGATTLATEGNIPLRVFPTSWGYLALHLEYTQDLPEDFKLTRRRAHYLRYDTAGDTLGEMDVLPGQEMIYRGHRDGEMTVMTSTEPLFGHTEHEAAVGDRFVAGVTDHFQLRVYGADGRLERLIRAPSRERPVTQEEWDRVLQDELAASEDTPEARRAVQEQAELAPAPEVRPAFDQFVADGEHYLWVGPYRPEPGPTVAWTIVDIDGPILGTVEVPRNLRILEVGADYILGSVRDDLGVETVRLYRLER